MKHVLPWLVLLGLLNGCLPTRRDVDGGASSDDAATDDTVDDAGDVSATSGDAKGDAKDAASDVPAADVPQLGCKTDNDCAAFNDPCHIATCDMNTRLCVATPVADGQACLGVDDKCAVSTTCKAGACITVPVVCDDSNPCTVEVCDPASGCPTVGTALPKTCGKLKNLACDCDDGNTCTIGDVCTGTQCKGEALKCDDKNPCTADTCDGTTPAGCVFTALSEGAACDDGQKHCTTNDKCVSGTCVGTPTVCDPGTNPCNITACIEFLGGCQTVAHDGAPCDDGDPCTDKDKCDGVTNPADGTCVGVPNTCDDKNECTDDACVAGTGCIHTPNAATTCKIDGTCATSGICAAGVCKAPPSACDDGNACTDDACDAKKGCVHTNNTAKCNDGNACTYSEACSGGTCGGSLDVSVDDGNDCTIDSCDPVSGPSWTILGNGSGCGTAKACTGGTCLPTKPCGDGICAATETVSACPADCSTAGGQCAVGDGACTDTCTSKVCVDAMTACNPGDDGCIAIKACADACSTPECTLACLLPTTSPSFATSVQLWLNVQWCRNAQCVGNGWIGKPCVPATPEYATCAAGCESALCLQAALTCQTTNGCPAQRTCLQACAADATCEAACTADPAATTAAQALLACTQNACQ